MRSLRQRMDESFGRVNEATQSPEETMNEKFTHGQHKRAMDIFYKSKITDRMGGKFDKKVFKEWIELQLKNANKRDGRRSNTATISLMDRWSSWLGLNVKDYTGGDIIEDSGFIKDVVSGGEELFKAYLEVENDPKYQLESEDDELNESVDTIGITVDKKDKDKAVKALGVDFTVSDVDEINKNMFAIELGEKKSKDNYTKLKKALSGLKWEFALQI